MDDNPKGSEQSFPAPLFPAPLYVAGRGGADGAAGGLYRRTGDTGWGVEELVAVEQLAALARHPYLPVVYGVSGVGDAGRMHAWNVGGQVVVSLAESSSGGSVPCHVAVHPSGGLLVATNYTSGSLTCWQLDDAGAPAGEPTLTALPSVAGGSGTEQARQDGPHPHQAVFAGDSVLVPDLGSDLVRRFAIDRNGIGPEVQRLVLPPGTGPRHLVERPDGTLVLSGELAQTLVLVSDDGWVVTPSTTRTGPARSRSDRNYPGDLRLSPDGSVAYLGNRGHDTVAVFELDGPDGAPELVAELDAGVRWAQHLLITPQALLVAGWDSSTVTSMPLDARGIPGPAQQIFQCPGACWLLAG